MTAKQVRFDTAARNGLMVGARILAETVQVTLGPKGRNVLLDQGRGPPRVTKDGATVAEGIQLSDRFENMGAALLREVASRANEEAGDGTTTAVVLAYAIAQRGMRAVDGGASAMEVKRGIDLAALTALEALKSAARPVEGNEDIARVGTVAANGEREIGLLIAEAMDKVDGRGAISIEEGERLETEIELVEGMQFDRGYLSPFFITDAEKMTVVMDNALVFACDRKLTALAPLIPLLEEILDLNRPVLVIAEDVVGEALASLVLNKLRGNLQVAAVRAPGFGERRSEMLEDIAILTGGTVFNDASGMKLEKVFADSLGSARRIVIERDRTTLIGGTGQAEAIASRVGQIRNLIAKADGGYDVEVLQERAAKLSGGVAIMRLGGASEAEIRERRDRVEDALAATRAAVEEGILPGGGVALMKSARALAGLNPPNGDQAAGIAAVRHALDGPLRRIAENAGVDGSVVAGRVLDCPEASFGYDAQTDQYGDMFQFGIIDPLKVVRTSLASAASVAGLLITTMAAIG